MQLVRDQVDRGWEVAVVSPLHGLLEGDVGPLAADAERSGARHVLWPAHRPPNRDTPAETRLLRRILRRERPDVVHLHSSKAGLAGRLVLRGGTPTVFHPNGWSFLAGHGLVQRGAVWWERFATRWAAAIICVSQAEVRLGEEQGLRARWEVIPNGVDLHGFAAATAEDRRDARARIGLGDEPLAVCVGRLSSEKGQDVLLEAWPAVLAEVPVARLVLVGSGRDDEALRAAAPDRVLFAGERDDVPDWLAAANVVAMPSRREGLPLTMLEAMARTRSVVCTDVGGAREAIGEDAGAVVPPEDPPQLARALARRLVDPERADAEGRAGRRRVERSYDLRATTRAVSELYERLVQ